MTKDTKNKQNNNKVCVLIIEEKTDLRTFFMGALTKNGNYEVINAATAQEGLDILAKEGAKVNMILFDWNMSGMSGHLFSQKIKAGSEFDHIELIVCSAAFAEEDTFLMSEIDIYYTMPKVVNVFDFTAKMEQARMAYLNSQSVVAKLKNLQRLLHQADSQAIEALLKESIDIEKEIQDNPKYAYLGGEIRIQHKKYLDAIQFLKDKLSQGGENRSHENLRTLSTLSKALCLAGNFEEALVIFERLEAKSPHNLHHKVMIGDALLGLDNVVGAEKKYDEVLQTDATNAGALAGMVKTSSVTGNFSNAKTFFDKIEGNFESSALASFFNNRGVALVKKGNVQEAIQFYENALQFFNKYKGVVYFNLGMAYFRSGNISSAVNSFQAAIAQEPALIQEKKILQELKEKGLEKFIEDYSAKKSNS
ncbi:MAG: tetratricopeptide repeat protein [Spirobacillus cienkowskii]|jgi:tetratricopeptide (TPR) repeat protein|uniref:Tetratricopeptide repeat protein n=1 Tax=Spirobacillus cienkowskii TaxID=495820 RepID=A0A369KMH7_9BACT|nr:MAG: tetratricopeptide repeat protein [Spirobacillus cienkowskii]